MVKMAAWCPGRESNPHCPDLKSGASASWATGAYEWQIRITRTRLSTKLLGCYSFPHEEDHLRRQLWVAY